MSDGSDAGALDDTLALLEQAARSANSWRDHARVLQEALSRAHACATLRMDGTCDGCFVSEALTHVAPAPPVSGASLLHAVGNFIALRQDNVADADDWDVVVAAYRDAWREHYPAQSAHAPAAEGAARSDPEAAGEAEGDGAPDEMYAERDGVSADRPGAPPAVEQPDAGARYVRLHAESVAFFNAIRHHREAERADGVSHLDLPSGAPCPCDLCNALHWMTVALDGVAPAAPSSTRSDPVAPEAGEAANGL